MQIYRSLAAVPANLGPSIVAIGNFDGVHCGHRAILDEVCRQARASHAHSVVVTFDPHPLQQLRPTQAPTLITPLAQKLRLLAQTGVDAVLVLPFTEEFSRQSAAHFVESILRDTLRATSVHEGDSFRFGYNAEAGIHELRALGAVHGFSVVSHPVLHRRGLAVSSSEIRRQILKGTLQVSRALLGRSFAIESTPATGRGIGTRLLVPTINLAPYQALKPAHGVYVTQVSVGERTFESITNAGNRPTFGEDSYAIESHLLNYDPATNPLELPDSIALTLTFLRRLRAEQRFNSPAELKQQIGQDIARARRYHALARRLASS